MNPPFWVTQQLEMAFSTAAPLQVIRDFVKLHHVDLRAWANSEHGPSQMPFRWACKNAPPAWKCEFVEWLLDECGYPLNATYTTIVFDQSNRSMTLLDYLIWRPGLGCAQVFSMLRQRGAQSTFGLHNLLAYMGPDGWHEPKGFKERCEFLLDCGAVPNVAPEYVIATHEGRCLARQRAIAMLSMRRKRPDLRGVVPRELWERMARYLWSLRFHVK